MCGVTRVFSGGNTPGFISILITGGNEHGTLVTEEWTLGARQVEIIENFFECRRSDAIPALDAIAGQVHFDRRQYARAQPNQKPVVTKKREPSTPLLDLLRRWLEQGLWTDALTLMVENKIDAFGDFKMSPWGIHGDGATLYSNGEPLLRMTGELLQSRYRGIERERKAAAVFNAGMRPAMEKIYDLVTWDTVKREAHEARIERNRVIAPLTYKQRRLMAEDHRARSIEHQIEAPSLVAAFAMPTSLDRSYHDQVAVGRPIALKLA